MLHHAPIYHPIFTILPYIPHSSSSENTKAKAGNGNSKIVRMLTGTVLVSDGRWQRGNLVVPPERHSAQPGPGVRQEHVLEVLVCQQGHLHPLAGAGLHPAQEAGTS